MVQHARAATLVGREDVDPVGVCVDERQDRDARARFGTMWACMVREGRKDVRRGEVGRERAEELARRDVRVAFALLE